MKRSVFDKDGGTLIRTDDAEPACGEDFCDACGDCLHCFGFDASCYDGRNHWWVQYGEDGAQLPKEGG